MIPKSPVHYRCAISVFTLALLWSSCATETTHTEKQGMGIGAAIGATAGAILGKQLFGDRGGVVVGAVIGGLLGAAGGQTWAQRVEQSRRQYQTEEQRLAATIQESAKIQTELEKENRQLAERVEQSKIEVAKLLADYQAQTIAQADLLRAKRSIDEQREKAIRERSDLERAIAAEQAELKAAKQSALVAASDLERQIGAHRQELSNLTQLEGELLQLSTSLST